MHDLTPRFYHLPLADPHHTPQPTAPLLAHTLLVPELESKMSSPSSPKRARPDDYEGSTPDPSARDKFSPRFNDPEADVLLRSRDGILYACQRSLLAASSTTFKNMFTWAQPKNAVLERRRPEQAAPGDLPKLHLDDEGERLEAFLEWIHPESLRGTIKTLVVNQGKFSRSVELYWVWAIADKYEALDVCAHILGIVEVLVDTQPEQALALATLIRDRKIAERALSTWLSYVSNVRTRIAVREVDLIVGRAEDEPTFGSLPALSPASPSYAPSYVGASPSFIPERRRVPWAKWRESFDKRQATSVSQIPRGLLVALGLGFAYHLDVALRGVILESQYGAEMHVIEFMDAFDSNFHIVRVQLSIMSARYTQSD